MSMALKATEHPKWYDYHFSEKTQKAILASGISFKDLHTYDTHTLLSKRRITRKVVDEIDYAVKTALNHRLPDSNAETEFLEGIEKDNLEIDDVLRNKIKEYIRYKRYKPKGLRQLGVSEEVLSLYRKVSKK